MTSPHLVTLVDPRPGTVVELVSGSRLCLRLRSSLGPSGWHLAALPGNLLPLVQEGCELSFLAFEGAPAVLRLERRHPRRGTVHEVCELRIEVSESEVRALARQSA